MRRGTQTENTKRIIMQQKLQKRMESIDPILNDSGFRFDDVEDDDPGYKTKNTRRVMLYASFSGDNNVQLRSALFALRHLEQSTRKERGKASIAGRHFYISTLAHRRIRNHGIQDGFRNEQKLNTENQ